MHIKILKYVSTYPVVPTVFKNMVPVLLPYTVVDLFVFAFKQVSTATKQ